MSNERARILVVDDHRPVLQGLCEVLRQAGYSTLTATDGREALGVLHNHTPDLILADIAMPVMNGYQLYEQVRANPAWALIPFIFLTGRAIDSDIRYGKALGVDDYLTKPFNPDDVLAVVHGKLRRARELVQRAVPAAPVATPQPETAESPPVAGSAAHKGSRVVTVGELCIDPGQHRAWLGSESIVLSAAEFTLLEYLARQVGRVISPEELVRVTHGLDTDRADAGGLVRPMISSLRRRLGYPAGESGCIENVRGVGYRLVEP